MSVIGRKRSFLFRALHHAEKRKVNLDKGEPCLSVASWWAAKFTEHRKIKWCSAQMFLGTFGETKVPRTQHSYLV